MRLSFPTFPPLYIYILIKTLRERFQDENFYNFMSNKITHYVRITTLPLLYRHGREGCLVDSFIAFIISVMASVVAYYICKWLDGEA